ncbi:glycoside hydrolase family 3 C-terminal domain-containing protein [Rhodococcus sp. ARC_M6]|uniref:glycoside hydrolase family 3 C-terminal domain-containing protein n=1 Tax=Rhodococcus sp. ARC_M6 TaxID=2928852 RepID=UPI001FB2FA7A|nr:glycoside hydrolase family 3 C-terminal domain-containing protein [Rhodococcus sp. ARC_M6]MCJ0903216.1 glycoside hydrolase family 3 C-terminal domain-containing protein [Rhodococcus sp. ARC_M6]
MTDTVEHQVTGLSLEDKASLTSGSDFWHSQAVSGIPSMLLTDGPHGVRKQPEGGDALGLGQSIPATCFPPAVGLGSSWNLDLIQSVGEALGDEAKAERVSVLLGPGINIKRSPLCGRNFEYVSEDPFLSGRFAASLITGVQSRGVGTSLKHFAANNQETDRMRVSADIDERTLREIYLAGFEYAITTAAPTTVMCSYNKINGVYASQDHWLLTEVLREQWGFDGLVVSDWGAVNDRVAAIAAGLDLEMPVSGTDGEIVDAVRNGDLEESVVDTAAQRVSTLVERTAGARVEGHTYDAEGHHQLARTAAAESAVLLENDNNILPLAAEAQTIAVIGEFARSPRYQGAGSSQVVPTTLDNALDAVQAIAGSERVSFAPGFNFDGNADREKVAEAVEAARNADVAVLFLGLSSATESEGFDRTDIDLPGDQLALLQAVHAVNPNTVVVLSNGGVVSITPWRKYAAAILEGWLLGQAGGSAIADILFGVVNPSGHLTETIPLRLQDNPSYLHFPGAQQHVRYGEGLYVGYRYYDSVDHDVAYPFGFGLSYTTFEVTETSVIACDNSAELTVTVRNSGERAGSTVVQTYVHDTSGTINRPTQELKGFAKIHLAPGETASATITLDSRAFSYWSVEGQNWAVEAGDYDIRVGFSSRDIAATERVTLTGNIGVRPLTPMSTIAEWFAHPVGGAVLGAAMAEAMSEDAAPVPPELMAMAGSMPLVKLAGFGLGMTVEQVDQLVAATQQ